MKPKILTFLALTLILSACGGQAWRGPELALVSLPTERPAGDPAPTRTISVSGRAEVLVVPDEVIITLGVLTFSEDINDAREQNDSIVAYVLDLTGAYGIEARYVKTGYISIEPRYENYSNQGKLLGYDVRKTITVTLRDLTQFDALLTSLLEAGVNYVQGIEFRTTELRKYRDQARALALQAAQEKATAMAGVLDQEVGQPLVISESEEYWRSGYSFWWGSWNGSPMQNTVQTVGGNEAIYDGALAPGQISVSASVNVQFELK